MNEKEMKVGICMPVYEKLDLFKRAMESIKKQSYSDYIVIITDNSSTDLIEAYLKEFSDMKILYCHNEKNLGASGNINKAISLAIEHKVDIIKILFQDDWFASKDSLEKMVHRLYVTGADVIFTGNYEVYPDKKAKHICSKEEIKKIKDDISYIFRRNCLGAPSNILYKLDATYFDATYTWLLDVDFYLRLLPGKKLDYIYEPLISIGHDGEQLTDFYTQNPQLIIRETYRQYRKYSCLHSKINRIHLYLYSWKIVKGIIRNLFVSLHFFK